MPHDPTRAQDPYRMALMELTQARNSINTEAFDSHIEFAKVHATLAVATELRELRHEYAAGHCPKCGHPTMNVDGDRVCDCGWSA